MPQEVKIVYRRAPDYRLLPATGAWGGPSVNGEIVVNFFVDRVQEPDSVILVVEEHSGTGTEKPLPPPQNVREMLVGVVMRPDIALSIGQFLVDKASLVLKKVDGPVN